MWNRMSCRPNYAAPATESRSWSWKLSLLLLCHDTATTPPSLQAFGFWNAKITSVYMVWLLHTYSSHYIFTFNTIHSFLFTYLYLIFPFFLHVMRLWTTLGVSFYLIIFFTWLSNSFFFLSLFLKDHFVIQSLTENVILVK